MQKLTTMEINLISESFWGSKKKASFLERLFRRNKPVNKALTTPEIIGKNCQGLLLKNELLALIQRALEAFFIQNAFQTGSVA